MTYDHSAGVYAIALARAGGWPEGGVFSLRFTGGAELTISTTRHVLSGDTLTVTDTGFGNVLNGLALNKTARAEIEGMTAPFDLAGARGPVEAFRTCAAAPVA